MTEPVPSTEHRSLGDAAYQRLRADIVSCRLSPGQRLTERSLAESTGFGVSPLRDALTRLDHEGLIRTLPRKGYQVTPLTLKSVDDLFTLWRIIAPEIARLGVRDATAEQHRMLLDTLSRVTQLKAAGADSSDSRLRQLELADVMLEILAAATQNDYLQTIWRRLQNEMARIVMLTVESDASMLRLAIEEEWAGIVERRDGDAAAAAMRAMLAEAHSNAFRIFSRWPSVAASEITPLDR